MIDDREVEVLSDQASTSSALGVAMQISSEQQIEPSSVEAIYASLTPIVPMRTSSEPPKRTDPVTSLPSVEVVPGSPAMSSPLSAVSSLPSPVHISGPGQVAKDTMNIKVSTQSFTIWTQFDQGGREMWIKSITAVYYFRDFRFLFMTWSD